MKRKNRWTPIVTTLLAVCFMCYFGLPAGTATADGASGTAQRPTSAAQTLVSVVSSATAKPSATVKPTATAKAAATVKATATVKPTATVKATATVRATATVKPTATAKATATAKPTATATPTATVKAAATVKPTATATAAVTAKGITAEKPSVTTAAPTVTAAPAATVGTDGAAALEEDEEIPLGISDLRVQEEMVKQNEKGEAAFSRGDVSGDLHADFDFGGVQALHGIFNKLSLYANLPEYVTPTGAVLRLSYTASDLILEDVSSLTFYMNGIPFASCSIVPSVERTGTVQYLSVPVDLLQNGYNLLEIEAYVRLTDDEGCRDDYNGANWIKLNEATCLRVFFDEAEDRSSLSLFPYPFLSIMDRTGNDCAVTVSDAAEECELTAAMVMMADLGNEVANESEIELCRLGETNRSHVIYLGLQKNTPQALLDLLDQPVPATGALVQRTWKENREYLLVVSQEEEALLEAVRYLADATRVEQTQAQGIHISVGEAQNYIDARNVSGLALQGQYTLKDILGHGASFYGPFHQETTLYLPLAQDYALSSEGRFSLNIRYSENLDFDRSMMTVYWGSDIPLVSRKLTKEGAAGETVNFAVPADAVGVTGTSMVIAFELEVKDLDCTPRQLNMPWAYVAENSTFYLPQGENTGWNLGTLPVPFQRNKLLNDLLLVLPDDANKAELMLAGRIMNMLGIGSEPYGNLSVVFASDFDSAMYDNNLVIVGTAENNALLRGMNDSLFFQFTDDFSAIASNDKLILDSDYATTVGTLQMFVSPYAQDRCVLAACAPEEEGLEALAELVSEEKKRWSLEREVVLVDERGNVKSYQFSVGTTTDVEEKPSFAQILAENQEPMLLMIIGMGCMLLVLITVIVVLVKIRTNKRD